MKTLSLAKSPPLQKQGRGTYPHISNTRFILLTMLAVAGFAAAIAVNHLVPQLAAVAISEYDIGKLHLNINQAYQLVLVGLILCYLITAAFAFFDPQRRAEFCKQAPFRFAIGLALAIWDVFGIKLMLLPQPFFPGPARIVEAFLMEPAFILQNTLYSLRLFTVGFLLGVLLGVGTGLLIGWFPKVYYW
ncbi:MAG: hypothetical protein LBS53_13445, partial [Synergistaceae bacterium]|nr:hypothetical protein [Synergistaceae bacterium]